MVFLNPAILFGLLAASIPILIHIINLRKLQRVEFSTLSFLKELQKSKIKKIKIKQWLLLLLRTLIIIFLVLAFARPTIESITLAGSTSTAKSSSVFIIDNSFSMDYIGDKGSLFNRSKKIAGDIISRMNENDEFIFILSLDSAKTVSSKASALKIVNNYKISSKSETTIEKILKAIEILQESQNINNEIYLFSDFQKSTFDVNNLDFLNDYASEDNIKFYAFDLHLDGANNTSVSDLVLENAIIGLNKNLTFSATVNNYSKNSTENIIASLFVNDKRVAQESLNLGAYDKRTIKFETQLIKRGLNEARVELEEDDILRDNTAFLNFYVPEKIRLLILYDRKNDIFFLETALNSIAASDQIEIVSHDLNNILSNNLSDFNLVIFMGLEVSRVQQTKEYLSNGGKILFVPPSELSKSQFTRLKAFINLPDIDKIVTADPEGSNYSEFGMIDFQHPIFASLFENESNLEIESPNIFKYIKFIESEGIKAIIRLIDDSIFMGEYEVNRGKVIFLNISPTLSWGNFPVKGIFAPLIARLAYYLSTEDENKKTYLSGEDIPLNIANIGFPLIDVSLPVGTEKIYVEENSEDIIIYGNTEQLGNYKFMSRNSLLYYTSVNFDPRESDLTGIDKDITEDVYTKLFENNYFILDPNDDFTERINLARFGTELWSYFLAIALILALIEMFVARSTKQDLMN